MVIMEVAGFPAPDLFASASGTYTDIYDATARDLTLDAAQAARASAGAGNRRVLSNAQLKKLLDSRNEREVLDGLRKVTSVCISILGNQLA